MKKNLFLHASKAIAGAFVLSLAFTACQKDTIREETSEEILLSSKGSKTSLSPVSLQVTIDNFEGAKITSDGSAYINGQQNVKAVIDENGHFLFNTQLSSTYPVLRSFNYSFSSQLDGSPYTTTVDGSKVANLNSIKASSKCIAWVPFQNMTVGESGKQFLGLGGGFIGAYGKQHFISFHRSAEEYETSKTAYAQVIRISNDVWEITPVGLCFPSQIQDVAFLRSGSGTRQDPTVLHGNYQMPFKFTLSRLQ
jgi:hypothetical protein